MAMKVNVSVVCDKCGRGESFSRTSDAGSIPHGWCRPSGTNAVAPKGWYFIDARFIGNPEDGWRLHSMVWCNRCGDDAFPNSELSSMAWD